MVNQTEEAFGSRVGIGSVSSARERGAMGNIQPSDATNALDVLAEERNRSENNLTPKEKFPITPKIESLAEEITKDLNELKSPSTSIRPKARPGLGSSIKTSDIPKSRPKTLAPETSDRPKGRPEKSYETAIKKAIELSYILKNESLDLTKSETQYVTALGLPTTVDVSELDNAQANEILGTKTGLNQLNPKHLTTITKFMTQALGAFDPNQDVTKDNVFWCAAFLNHILTELGADTLGKGDKYNRLRAQQYENYGQEISFEDMQEGDILLYGNPKTGEIGHVGFYTGERDGDSINMLGGNQYDFFGGFVPEVNIVPRNIRDIVGVRRVTYAGDSAKIVEDQKDNNSIFRYFDADTYGASFIPTENKTYSEGGEVSNMNKQTEMAFMNQGGLKDDGMKQDPVSGNSVPNGSMANEVRDDIPAQLSEGEYVVPADVVRYYGVKHFEDIRNKAKSGLQSMEANGRIGGEPVPVGGPKAGMQQQQPPTPYNTVPTQPQQQMSGGLNQGEMNEIQSMMMAVGGFVEEPNNMQQGSDDPYQQQQTMYQQPMAMGAFNGTDVSGFGFTPAEAAVSTPNPQAGDGSFSRPPTSQAPTQVTQTIMILYSPDGLITRSLNLPADQIEYDNLIAQGYVTTKPTVAQKSSGGSRSSGSGGTPSGNSPIVDKDWGEGVDWTKPGEYADKIYDSVKNLDNMAGAGFAGASLLGAPAIGIALGVGAKFKIGAAVSDLHAAAIIAEARGLPDEVKRINDMADSLIKSGGGLLQFANYLGMMSGDEKGKNRLDELGYQYGKDDDGSPIFNSTQTKYNSNLGSTPTPEAKSSGPTFAQRRMSDRLAAEAKGEKLKETNAEVASASEEYEANQAANAANAAAAAASTDTSGAGALTRGGPGGTYGVNKGGLMTSKKKKKKTKGK